jgi:ComF family protein
MSDRRITSRALGAVGHALDAVLDWVYPRHCYHCGDLLLTRDRRLLCGSCVDHVQGLLLTGPICALCGLPLAGKPQDGTLCTLCRTERRHFDVARALVEYHGPVVPLVHAFKFDGEFFLGARLVEGLLRMAGMPDGIGVVDAVAPVPLHRRRRRERGYDQSLLLARACARQLRAPLLRKALVRERYTPQQALLPVGKRWDNVRAAFTVRRPDLVARRRILLVDDVMTSGNTVSECSRVLRAAGAEAVMVLALARAVA